MAEDTRLGVGIVTTADTSQLKTYQRELAALEKALRENYASAARMGQTSSGVTRAIETEIAAVQKNIAALRGLAAAYSETSVAMQKFTTASSQRLGIGQFATGSELTALHAKLKNEREAIKAIVADAATSTGVMFNTLSQNIARSVGAGTDRELKNATASAGVFERSLSSMAATDIVARGAKDEIAASTRRFGQVLRETTVDVNSNQGAIASWFSGFMRGGRTPVSLFDEMMRGQRGQMASTLGASLRAAGTGGLLGALIPVGAAAGVAELTSHFGHLAQETQNAAAAAGMSVSQYSLLARTLQLVDGRADSVDRMFGILTEKMQEALADPTSKAGDAFGNLHISAEQLANGLEHPVEMLEVLRHAWQSLASEPGLRTGIFHDLLGRQFQELVPIIQMTDEEFRRFTDDARASGAVFGENVDNLTEVAQASNRLSEAMSGLGIEIANVAGSSGLPDRLASVVRGLTDATKQTNEFLKTQNTLGKLSLGAAMVPPLAPPVALLHHFFPGMFESPTGTSEAAGGTAYHGTEPGPPSGTMGMGSTSTPFSFAGTQKRLQAELKAINDRETLEKAKLDDQIARAQAGHDSARVNSLEKQRVSVVQQAAAEAELAHKSAAGLAARSGHAADVPKLMEGTTDLQAKSYEADAEAIRKKYQLQREGESQFRKDLEAQRHAQEEQRAAQVKAIRETAQLKIAQEQDVHTRAMRNADEATAFAEARFGRRSPQFRAADQGKEVLESQSEGRRAQISNTELAALQARMVQDQASLAKAQAGKPAGMNTDDWHNWVTQLQHAYDEDVENFAQAQRQKQDMLNQQFQRQTQTMVQMVESEGAMLKQQSDNFISDWAQAFNTIGSQAEATGQEMIHDLFVPQKPEYWWSTQSGPMGQPLMVPHRISPFAQIAGGFGTEAIGALGGALVGTLTKTLAMSLFQTKDLGTGLAKMIGVGGPGGLFGTGLGAVAQSPKMASDAVIISNLPVQTSLLSTIASALGVSNSELAAITSNTASSGAAGAAGAVGGIGSFLGSIPVIGSALSWVGNLFNGGGGDGGVAAGANFMTAMFKSGGIVPSAAGGWVLGEGGSGGIPAILHSREMVLPAHISQGLQAMIEGGGGGAGPHLHFHGPADGPSIERWFSNFMRSNPKAIRDMFKYNSLTPRNLSSV